MKILYLIPARAGSKRLPGKNIKILNGKPLVEYSVDYARLFDKGENIWVSTDDRNMPQLNCCIMKRRADLSKDDTPMIDVIKDILKTFRDCYDTVVLLQPTSPFRKKEHLEEAMKQFIESKRDILKSTNEHGELNGSIYIYKVSALEEPVPSITYYQMDDFYSVDINTPFDFWVAEQVGKHLNNNIIWGGCEAES